jgi:hypothetical protein
MARWSLHAFFLGSLLIGCAQAANPGAGGAGSSTTTSAGQGGSCPLCTSDQDCSGGGVCAQLASDSYCAPPCDANNQCANGLTCVVVSTVAGAQASVCVMPGSMCAPDSSTGGAPPGNTCGTFVGPTVAASCKSCKSGTTCQTNGCYGGWWCDTATNTCHAQPTDCGQGGSPNVGPPPTGSVGPNGGTLSHLLFTVIGDTRPAVIDDTAGYPNAIINKLYGDIQAVNPLPPFSISTGDYMFASPYGSNSGPQLDLYLAARQKYKGVVFFAMGNHECTGGTASNCGAGNADGMTNNYSNFMSKLLGPIGKTLPYYSININGTDGTWTSKFVFIAANAWSSAQASWLDTTLAAPTTYTFVIRHESKIVTQTPGVTPSEQIITAHPFTLEIVGHTHTYEHFPGAEAVIGNGGAPLTGSKNYGYGLFVQRADGNIQGDMIDYMTGTTDSLFHFVVKPNGTATN